MINKPQLGAYIDLLIQRKEPEPQQLNLFASAIQETCHFIHTAAAKHRSGMRRRKSICSQTSVLVRYADELYLEWRYQNEGLLARALILLLRLIEQLMAELPGTCRTVPVPKVLLDRAYRRYGNSRESLENRLSCAGVSAELCELALLALDILTRRERMDYKAFSYILKHLRLLAAFGLSGEHAQQADELLSEQLICINYNNLQFLDFCISLWKSNLESITGKSGKLKFFRAERKRLVSLKPDNSLSYDSRFVVARTALLNWLAEEQKRLTEKHD